MFGHSKFFFGTLRKYTIYFGTMFNDIYIAREDSNETELQIIKVPLSYGPRNPQLLRTDSSPELRREPATILPRMSFKYESFQYDSSRKIASPRLVVRKNATDLNKVKTQFTAVPYDIIFTLNTYTNTIEDGQKIVEQILPNFTPDYTATVNIIPEMDISLDIPVILMDIHNEEIYEGDFTTERRGSVWTLTFKMKAWFFGPIVNKPIIKLANTNFYIGNTTSVETISTRVRTIPGMDANGNPTSNAMLSVPFANIAIDDTYGYIIDIEDSGDVNRYVVNKLEDSDSLTANGTIT